MHRHILSLLTLLCLLLPSALQAKQWEAYSYTDQYQRIARLGNYLYILKGSSLVRADATTWQLDRQLDRECGLSGTNILDICYSHELDCLAVVYTDGMIDVIHADGSIWTIPDYANAPMAGTDKTITSVREQQGLLFLHTVHGFAIADLSSLIFLHHFNFGKPVSCAWAYGAYYFYSDADGSYYCPRQDSNPYLASSWLPTRTPYHITRAIVIESEGREQCWLMRSSKAMCRIYPGETNIWQSYSGGTLRDIQRAGRYVMASTSDSLVLFDTSLGIPPMSEKDLKPGQRIACLQSSPYASPQAISVCTLDAEASCLAFLYPDRGILADSITDVTRRGFSLQELHDAPLTISNYQQSPRINRLVTSPNGDVAMTFVPPLTTGYGAMLNIDGFLTTVSPGARQWTNLTKSIVIDHIVEGTKRFCAIDAMIADPIYPERYWFSTLEDGIWGIDHGQLYAHYDASTTNGGIDVCAPRCTRVGGMGLNVNGDLWCFDEGHNYGLRVRRRADGKWYKFRIEGLEKEYGFTHLCVTRRDGRRQVWGCQQMKYEVTNVFCYDYGSNVISTDDDRYVFFKTLTPDHLGATAVLPYYNRDICEGPTGSIWLLNTSGLYIIDDPDAVFEHPGRVREVMADVIPTSMAIDSRDHVWISTEGQGLLLFSADGRRQLAQFTKANSILSSDDIQSITYEPTTSTLWIACEGQILAFAYDPDDYGTEAEEWHTTAYCYPSRVGLSSGAEVNVFGLRDETQVTITNSQGRILHQDTALGGVISIPTGALSVGTYTISGIDTDGHRGELLTFEVEP